MAAVTIQSGFSDLLAKNGASGVYIYNSKAVRAPGPVIRYDNKLTASAPGTVVQGTPIVTSDVLAGQSASSSAEFTNNTSTAQSYSTTLSESLNETTSNTNTTTSALSFGGSTEFNFEVGVGAAPGPSGKVGGKISANFNKTDTNSDANTTSTSVTRTVSTTASPVVQPGATIHVQLEILVNKVTIPYEYDVTLDGGTFYSYKTTQGPITIPTYESSGEVVFYAKKNGLPPYSGVNYNNLSVGQQKRYGGLVPYRGQDPGDDYNQQHVKAYYKLNGQASASQGSTSKVITTEVRATSDLLTSPGKPVVTAARAPVTGDATSAAAVPPDKVYYAPVDTSANIGDYIELDASHTHVVGTALDDEIIGGVGDDTIDAGDGNNLIYGGSGNDVIMAEGTGINTLVGGAGYTHFVLNSTASGNMIQGGQGGDIIEAYAPDTYITGGAGTETIKLNTVSAGTVITVGTGSANVTIDGGTTPVRYAQEGFALIALLNGDATYAPDHDIAITNFFENADNSVNGLSAAALAEITQDGVFAATPPTITGTAGQATTDNTPIKPFSNVVVSDTDPGSLVDLTISLTNGDGNVTDANGTLAGDGLSAPDPSSPGTYTVSAASPEALSAELNALTFTPTSGHVLAGDTVTTGFTLTAAEAGIVTSDSNTTVTTTALNYMTGPSSGGATLIGTADGDVITAYGSYNTISGGDGTDSIFGGTGNDIFILPSAARGFDTISGFSETNGDVLDLRQALAKTGWDGMMPSLGNYLLITDDGNDNTTLSTAGSSSASGLAIATLKGAGNLGLSDLLSHHALST